MKDFYDIFVPERSSLYKFYPVEVFLSCFTKDMIASSPKLFRDMFKFVNLRLFSIPINELMHYSLS